MATAKASTTKTNDTVEVKGDAKLPLNEVRKPLYAYVGAADLAVEKLRELPSRYTAELKKRRGDAESIQTQVKDLPTTLQKQVKDLPQTVKSQLTEISEKVNEVYEDLAGRGERLVTSVRKDPATQSAVEHGKTAVRQAKGARTSARKAAGDVSKAAEDTANKVG